jgi:hypothetical protein
MKPVFAPAGPARPSVREGSARGPSICTGGDADQNECCRQDAVSAHGPVCDVADQESVDNSEMTMPHGDVPSAAILARRLARRISLICFSFSISRPDELRP